MSRPEDLTPYAVHVEQSAIDDLHDRLDRTRWPDELPGLGWDLGVPLDYLRELADHWRHRFDWRAAEARLNDWPQLTTEIDGARVHAVHLRSPEPDATPLVLTHGWPGSVVEFTDVAGPLTDPRSHGGDPADAFHLVMPSIPGYGFSGPTRDRGWDPTRVAGAFATLMARLGYDSYGAQGGDWGSSISRELGRLAPEHVLGVHLNMLVGSNQVTEPTPEELADLDPALRDRTLRSYARTERWRHEEAGYGDIQATRPQTLAYALTDSPVGQLAWVIEKFFEWTDSRERPEDAVDRDLLLTNASVYWFTATAGSSARLYYERAHAEHRSPSGPSGVPTAFADFPHDINVPLRHRAEQRDRLVQWTEHPHGGHFAALEQPDALVEDVRRFFHGLRVSRAGGS